MTEIIEVKRPPLDSVKTLLLNGDYQPLSQHPLSAIPWRDAIKLVYEDVVTIVRNYDDYEARSPSTTVAIPSVVALKRYVKAKSRVPFTKYNVFLRDDFTCQYCNTDFRGQTHMLTFDHVVPRAKGGLTSWTNISTACRDCNGKKDCMTCEEAKMWPIKAPYEPSMFDLAGKAKKLPTFHLHETWRDFVYWDTELDP